MYINKVENQKPFYRNSDSAITEALLARIKIHTWIVKNKSIQST